MILTVLGMGQILYLEYHINYKLLNLKNMKYLFILFSVLGISFLNAQVENIIVEKYYVSDQFDSTDVTGGKLDSGSVTYRIYVDLPKGQKLTQMYGDDAHPFTIKSTDNVFNNTSDGQSFGFNFKSSIPLFCIKSAYSS